jgi:hypothetical protein
VNWWLRVHLVRASLAALAACVLAAPLVAGSLLPFPSLLGGGFGGGVPLPLVLPVLPACVLLHATGRAPEETTAAAVRPTGAYAAALAVVAAAVALALGSAEALWLDFGPGPAVARNFAGYLGAGLIVRALAGPLCAPVAVAAIPVVCAFVGLGPGRRPYPWAWPLHESGHVPSAVAALALFAAGAAVAYLRTGTAGGRTARPGVSHGPA